VVSTQPKDDILEPLFDRFERYFLTTYSDDEFIAIAARRLKQEGIDNEELALYIANSVLRGLNSRSIRDIVRIARKSKTMDNVDETILALRKYGLT
jgi:ATP-dependent Lon protease